MLDATDRPVYVVDGRRRIVFCNRACEDWTGVPRDELIGIECQYHSREDVSPARAAAAALCPPPAVLSGEPLVVEVSVAPSDRPASSRLAQFVPLGLEADDAVAVVVVVSDEDEPTEVPARPVDELDAAELHQRLRQHRKRLKDTYRVDSLIGISPAIARVRSQIVLAAGSDVNVSLSGPPGSGRQHVARAIHYSRTTEVGPLVPLACPLLGSELLSTTITALVHFEDKPQTGGHPALLLRDADCLPAEVQAWLADRMAAARFPLRIISTARRPLVVLAGRGDFREDLACALTTIAIELPSLVDRLEDLPLLAQAFLERINAEGQKQLGGFSPRALDRLAAYSWPEGIDELSDVVGESHQQCEAHEVTESDLPKRIRFSTDAMALPRATEEPIVLDEFLAEIETELIQRALKRAKGNKTKAAKLLGLNRPRLYRRLVQLGLAGLENVDEP